MDYIKKMEYQGDMSSLGPNIFPAQPGQLPPEAYQSQTPTVRTLPPKIVKNTLPPQDSSAGSQAAEPHPSSEPWRHRQP